MHGAGRGVSHRTLTGNPAVPVCPLGWGQAEAQLLRQKVGGGVALTRGEKVILVGFGTFQVIERKARKGRTAQTGQAIQIPDKKDLKLRPGKGLEGAVE